jgi:hypothetical protein
VHATAAVFTHFRAVWSSVVVEPPVDNVGGNRHDGRRRSVIEHILRSYKTSIEHVARSPLRVGLDLFPSKPQFPKEVGTTLIFGIAALGFSLRITVTK